MATNQQLRPHLISGNMPREYMHNAVRNLIVSAIREKKEKEREQKAAAK